MRIRPSVRAAFIAVLAVWFAGKAPLLPAQESAGQLYIAFWNVENLFDLTDDPGVDDEEFTPVGEKRWTRQRLLNKFHGMTRVLNAMNDGRGPDLLGLAEVENLRVLQQWQEEDLREYAPASYGIALHESPDQRGIDLAVLYREDVFTHIATRGHRVPLGGNSRPTRDISVFTLAAGSDTLDCVLVHWPSRYGGREQTEPRRIRAARTTAGVIDSLYKLRRNDDIILMGDFNDEPANVSVRRVLASGDDPADVGGGTDIRLLNSMWDVYRDPERGSYYYGGEWNTLDQILLGHGLLDTTGFAAPEPTGQVFVQPYMREQTGEYQGTPYRTYVGNRYLGGMSDHFPVFIRLTQR